MAAFGIDQITVLSATGIRLHYTAVPLAADVAGVNDALNQANYTLVAYNSKIKQIVVVDGDPFSFDLLLTAPLANGTWTLTVSNIQTPFGVTLTGTTALSFTFNSLTYAVPAGGGALNVGAEAHLKRHLGKAFVGKAWNALVAAIAVGDQTNWSNAQYAFDQKFKISASGKYLDRKMSDDGVVRPQTLGISDDVFRKYGIKLNATKLTSRSILDMLEVFYGADSTRGVATSGLAEPFNIQAGDDLQLLLDEKQAVSIIFAAGDFGTVGAATANEVAIAITRYLRQNNSTAYAVSYRNPSTNTNFVKIYSSATGLGSSVRVTGGKTQTVLQFGILLSAAATGTVTPWLPSWTVTQPAPGISRFTTTGTVNLNVSTEDFSTSVWINGYTVTNNATTSPIGTPAQMISVSVNGSQYAAQQIIANGGAYTWSVWVKAVSGTLNFTFQIYDFTTATRIDNAASNTYTATTTWQRFTCTVPASTTGHKIAGQVYPGVAGANAGTNVYWWGAQFEQGAIATNYVPVKDSTQRSITNQLYWSESFTNLVWTTDSIGTTLTAGAADPTGGTGGTTYLVDATHTGSIHQNFYAAGGPYTLSVWAKTTAGTVTLSLGIYDSAQGKYVSNPASPTFTATTTWQRFSVSAPSTISGNLHGAYIYNNTIPSGSVIIWGAMLETNSSLSGVYATSTATRGILGNSGSGVDLTQVKAGDYANIFATFNTNNRGSLPISNVSISIVNSVLAQSFDVANVTFTGETVQQAAATDLMFFRPIKNATSGVAVNSNSSGLTVSIPATTKVVTRGNLSGAYLQGQIAVTPTSITRNGAGVITINTLAAHGLAVGQQVLLENAYPAGVVAPAVNAGTTTATSASVGSIWSDLQTVPVSARTLPAACATSDGLSVVIVGGSNAGTSYTDIAKFTITGNTTLTDGSTQYTFTFTTPTTTYASSSATCTLISSVAAANANRILIAGGRSAGLTLATTALFNSTANTISAGPNLSVHRALHTATSLNNTKIIIAGGDIDGASITNTTDLYDPKTNTITAGPAMATARASHRAIALNSGKVLIIGGKSTVAGSPLASCEIYDPVANTFAATGSMTFARYDSAAVLLPDGKVLVCGGQGFNVSQSSTVAALASAEIYDPGTGSWLSVANMSIPRVGHFAGYLSASKKVLVAGANPTTTGVTSCEYYDTTTGRWIFAPFNLVSDQTYAAGAVLSNGTVFLGFGQTNSLSQTRSQLFIPTSDSYSSGKLNGVYQIVSVPSSTQFTLQSTVLGYSSNISTGATYTAMASPAGVSTSIVGPYIFEPRSGFAITSTAGTTTGSSLFANQKSNTVSLLASAGFTDVPAAIVIGYGTNLQQGPIKVLGTQNSTTLSIDPTYTFTATIPDGTSVIKLFNTGGYVPTNPQSAGAFYLTSSGAGRQAASLAIDNMTAGGIAVVKSIVFPGDRGLGNEGKPVLAVAKMSDVVRIFGSDSLDTELKSIGGGI